LKLKTKPECCAGNNAPIDRPAKKQVPNHFGPKEE
jgi:hypothetical protein